MSAFENARDFIHLAQQYGIQHSWQLITESELSKQILNELSKKGGSDSTAYLEEVTALFHEVAGRKATKEEQRQVDVEVFVWIFNKRRHGSRFSYNTIPADELRTIIQRVVKPQEEEQ